MLLSVLGRPGPTYLKKTRLLVILASRPGYTQITTSSLWWLRQYTTACGGITKTKQNKKYVLTFFTLYVLCATELMVHSLMMLVKFRTSANQKHWIWSRGQLGLCNPRLRLIGDDVVVCSNWCWGKCMKYYWKIYCLQEGTHKKSIVTATRR